MVSTTDEHIESVAKMWASSVVSGEYVVGLPDLLGRLSDVDALRARDRMMELSERRCPACGGHIDPFFDMCRTRILNPKAAQGCIDAASRKDGYGD